MCGVVAISVGIGVVGLGVNRGSVTTLEVKLSAVDAIEILPLAPQVVLAGLISGAVEIGLGADMFVRVALLARLA
jgi:hypothetical protein